jgi:integrase
MAKGKFNDARLFRRGKSRYIWTRLPGGRRESTKCTNERAATAYANRREREIADPRIARAQAKRWDDAVIDLLDELRRRGRAPATIDKNERKLAHYPRVWGSEDAPAVDMAIGDIDADKVNAYIDQRLREGVKRITIRDELVALGQLLKLQRRAKRYPHDVAEVLPVQWETGHKPRERWLTRDEYKKLLTFLPRKRQAHLAYSIAIGGRMSEVARALNGDIGVDTVLVRGTKTAAARQRIPVTEIMKPLLVRVLSWSRTQGHTESDLLFEPWTNINRDLKDACARAGIPPVSTNDLRRTFAQWHADAGIEPSLLAPMLRHTTDKLAQTTYGKTTAERVGRLVAERLKDSDQHKEVTHGADAGGQSTPDETRERKPPTASTLSSGAGTRGGSPLTVPPRGAPAVPESPSATQLAPEELRQLRNSNGGQESVTTDEVAPPARLELATSALGKPEPWELSPYEYLRAARGVPEVDAVAQRDTKPGNVLFACDVRECGARRWVPPNSYAATLKIYGTCKSCRTGFMRRVKHYVLPDEVPASERAMMAAERDEETSGQAESAPRAERRPGGADPEELPLTSGTAARADFSSTPPGGPEEGGASSDDGGPYLCAGCWAVVPAPDVVQCPACPEQEVRKEARHAPDVCCDCGERPHDTGRPAGRCLPCLAAHTAMRALEVIRHA